MKPKILLGASRCQRTTEPRANVTFGGLWANLIPVTLGNIVGGALFVAGIYWFCYLKDAAK